MNGAILYPTDDELMTLGIIYDGESALGILRNFPDPPTETLAYILHKTAELAILSIIKAYIEVYDYKPLKINESVLG